MPIRRHPAIDSVQWFFAARESLDGREKTKPPVPRGRYQTLIGGRFDLPPIPIPTADGILMVYQGRCYPLDRFTLIFYILLKDYKH